MKNNMEIPLTLHRQQKRRISIAPMLDWTDAHCRFFHRTLTQRSWLYTEMVTTGALLYGDLHRHLDFNEEEHPIALQLGGSEPADLAKSARLGEQWGYDEINLNCGCPSERVQRGAFGACLMNEPQTVADCVKAMQDAVSVEVTVKHRLGLDYSQSYDFMRDFVGTVALAGCRIFIVHARNAVLKGLSPKENRLIPPLNYDFVYRLKHDFPDLEIILNGGIDTLEKIDLHLKQVDGVMIGRAAYHHPYLLASFDNRYYQTDMTIKSRADIVQTMLEYCINKINIDAPIKTADNLNKHRNQNGTVKAVKLNDITRHMLGLMTGLPGARTFRQILSDPKKLGLNQAAVLLEALQQVRFP